MIMNKIVVNGTFDIIHRGHIELLNYAKSLGGYLLVCIDTDKRVEELKGRRRPINNQNDRKFLLENLKSVDEVRFFNSREDLIEILKAYEPDIMVKGSDWQGKSITAGQYCKKVVFYDRVGSYSTSNTIQDIITRG